VFRMQLFMKKSKINLTNKFSQSKCPYINLNLSILFSGISVCCWNEIKIKNDNGNTSFLEFWNCKKLNLIRNHIINNEIRCPKFCPVLNGCPDLFYPNHPSQSPLWYEKFSEWPSNFSENGPLVLQIDYDHACNLNCTMCNNTFYKNIKRSSEQCQQINNWILSISKNISDLLVVVQGGEPFYSAKVINFINAIKEKRDSLRFGIITNALFWDQKFIQNIPLAGLIVSSDGSSSKIYERIRRGAKFEKFITKLKEIIDYAGDYLPIQLNFTIMNSNLDTITEAVEYYQKLGIKKIKLCPVLVPDYHPEFIFSKTSNIKVLENECDNLEHNFPGYISQNDLILLRNLKSYLGII
jgi:organic radical activating enzyme